MMKKMFSFLDNFKWIPQKAITQEEKYTTEHLLSRLKVGQYIHEGMTPREIMDRIQGAYEDGDFPPEFDDIIESKPFYGNIFNVYNENAFMDYCGRWGYMWEQEIINRAIHCPNFDDDMIWEDGKGYVTN